MVVAVCQHAHLDACGQRGFRMYYELGSPTLYAPDSVSVHVDYLSEAVDLCRIHRAVLNAGGEDFILFKVGGKWLYGDADAASVMDVGFGSCGPSDTLAYPRRRQPN